MHKTFPCGCGCDLVYHPDDDLVDADFSELARPKTAVDYVVVGMMWASMVIAWGVLIWRVVQVSGALQ